MRTAISGHSPLISWTLLHRITSPTPMRWCILPPLPAPATCSVYRAGRRLSIHRRPVNRVEPGEQVDDPPSRTQFSPVLTASALDAVTITRSNSIPCFAGSNTSPRQTPFRQLGALAEGVQEPDFVPTVEERQAVQDADGPASGVLQSSG